MLSRWWGSLLGRRSIARSVMLVGATIAISRILGLVREVIVAARFGTGETYDAYIAAFRIPDLLFALVIGGAFGSAFIPVFGGFLARHDKAAAWRLANALLTWTIVLLAVISVVILLAADALIGLIVAPDLSPAAHDLAVRLTRILLVSPLLLGLSVAAKGMLEAHDMFVLPAAAALLYNLGIIAGAVVLVPAIGIYGLVVGVLAGALAQWLVQMVALWPVGFRFRPSLAPGTPGLGSVARLLGPRVAGQGASQANLIVMTNLASALGEGGISSLNYANQLVMVPHGVLALSMSTVLFPRMSRQFATGDLVEMRQSLLAGIGPLLFLVVPVTIALVVLSDSIVHVTLQYGAFDGRSAGRVTTALALLALALPARSVIEPVTRAFYAAHDTRTPLYLTTFALGANVVLGSWLSDRYGLPGLAAAFTVTYLARMLVLVALLARRLPGLGTGVAQMVVHLLLPATVMLVAAVVLMGPLDRMTDPAAGRSAWGYLALALGLAGCGAAYLLTAWFRRNPELLVVRRRFGDG